MPFIALVVMLEWKPYDNKIKYEKIIENVNEKINDIDDNDESENEKSYNPTMNKILFSIKNE